MLHQWVLFVSVVIVVLSYCENQVQAHFKRRGFPPQWYPPFGFPPNRYPFYGPAKGFRRNPYPGWVLAANPNAHENDADEAVKSRSAVGIGSQWVLAANPNAHENDDDQAVKSRSAEHAGYDDALQVVHYGDQVEELQDLGLEPSALIGFYNEDGTIGEWSLGEEPGASGAEEIVGRKHHKLDCDDVFGKHSKKKRKFCRKMAAYNEDHGYDHHDYDHHGSYGHAGHKYHKHHKHHGSYDRYRRQLPYLSNLPVEPLSGIPVPTRRPIPTQAAYRRYKRQLPYLGNTQLPSLGQLPGTPPVEQSVPLSGTLQVLPVQQITQINRPRLVRNSIIPNPDSTVVPQRLAQVKFLDTNGSEMLAPYQLQSHHHEQHSCPAGTVANYNFFHFSCPTSVSSIDGAALRNHPKRYIDTNAWSQFPHRIEKRKGVGLEQLAPAPPPSPVNVERVFALTTTETVPEASTTEDSRTTESPKESLRKPPRRKTLPTRGNKIFQRKLNQWRLQNIRDKEEQTTLEPIVVLSSRESVEEGAPANRLRDTRDSNVRPVLVTNTGEEADNRQRARPRPHSNRGELFLNRLFAPAAPNPNPFDPPKRAVPQSPPSRTTPRWNNRRGEKLVSRYLKARQPTTTTAIPTTTTPEPTTTTTTTLRTTTKRFPQKHNMDDANRRRTRYRLRPKKSIQDNEYETFAQNTLQTDPTVSRKSEPTKRRQVLPRRPFRLGKIKPLKVKQPAREPAVTESLVKQGRWEEIFAIKTNENHRNHPRRSVDSEPEVGASQQDARWRLKRAQQFIRRQLRNWRTTDPREVLTTTTTTSTTTTTVRPQREGEDRRHRRPARPVGRQGRQRSESSEVVNLGRYDVNGQLHAASSNQEGVLSPKVQEYIASKVKEACDKCTPSNEILRAMNNCAPRSSRADHTGTRSKNSVHCEPRERSVRTSTPSAMSSFAASPLRNLFKWDLFKPWRNLLTAPTS